ncbi:hypothetical protein [Pseudomonas putida]|uniref:Uncharacterized protein n=1 Tax=Pseudomonas putida TaxID=303 RepID=A0A8I1EBS5_PSEPU|nr:hypothetical protein [Pseudomonas putida]MBI6883137.1 hypothetical protein [Pseudomonas putida]
MDTQQPVTLYIVAGTIGGFAREDAAVPSVAGAFTDEQVAKKVASVTHGQVIPVELDVIKPGILESLKAFGFKIPGAG